MLMWLKTVLSGYSIKNLKKLTHFLFILCILEKQTRLWITGTSVPKILPSLYFFLQTQIYLKLHFTVLKHLRGVGIFRFSQRIRILRALKLESRMLHFTAVKNALNFYKLHSANEIDSKLFILENISLRKTSSKLQRTKLNHIMILIKKNNNTEFQNTEKSFKMKLF